MSATWVVQANRPTTLPCLKVGVTTVKSFQVPGALPRIVGKEDVAFLHGLDRIFGDEMLDAGRHGIDVTGGSGDGLGQHPAPGVIDACRNIPRLPRAGGEGGADQHLRLLLHHSQQSVPLDLPLQVFQRGRLVGAGVHGRFSPAARQRHGSSQRSQPGSSRGSISLQSRCSAIDRAARASPGGNSLCAARPGGPPKSGRGSRLL